MIRFILKASDPDDLKWAFDLADEALNGGYPVGSLIGFVQGRNPTLVASVRVNPKSISVHCVRKNG